jgi:hypothetical protein
MSALTKENRKETNKKETSTSDQKPRKEKNKIT